MTVPVRSLLVMLVTALVTTLTSFRAVADDPPIGSAAPAAVPSAAPAAPPAVPAPPPAASAAPRQWLAQPQGGTLAVQAPKSSWRPYAIVLFTLALGGGALYLRLNRRKQIIANASPALRVVSTVRIGPKAHLVMAQVGKKTLLLGVTDSAVQRVAWLDSESLQAEPEGEQEAEPSAPIHSKPAVQIAQGAQGLEQQPAFNNVLRNLMKVTQSRAQEMAEEPDDPAVQIARTTRDSFEDSAPRGRATKPNRRGLSSAAQESPSTSDDFEDQVSGLARRQPRRRG